MRSYFKFIFCLIFFVFNCHYDLIAKESKEFVETYIIEVANISVGKLFWKIVLSENSYNISIKLEDKGPLSFVYSFNGAYETNGFFIDGIFIPSFYSQSWKTKKKKREVSILFEKNSLSTLTLFPKEKEHPRIQYIGLKNYLDPLSAFLNILVGSKTSKTVDGRRIYSMIEEKKEIIKNIINKKIIINNYRNIWADHNRNDLEYIEIFQEDLEDVLVMPQKMIIKFDNVLFNLKKI